MTKSENSLILALCILGILSYFLYAREEIIQSALKEQEQQVLILQQQLNELPLEARAISVFDKTIEKKVYGKNDTEILPLASLGKIMTVITALQPTYKKDFISISPFALMQEGEDTLIVDELWRTEDLAKFTLISSSNAGAYALAENEQDFIQRMNTKAKRIGMQHTFFYNVTGLDIDKNTPGSYGTAEDINKLSLYAFLAHPDIFGDTARTQATFVTSTGITHHVENTNIGLNSTPNIIFSKTGFTKLAGGNLTILFIDIRGHTIAVTVLGSSISGRFFDMEKIVNLLYNFPYAN